ncbi:MAG: protease modulator HflK [Gammaproteobacteria bacterium]|nr:protease modulator HflK [Gammaproteobacteria bacterium]MDE0414226.1 protease modulator HflK [Gammaproteobacteria bacterium]MDE0455353.1 protease modulator HflK [Gammaproteobacteria bacterium]
MSEKLPPSTRAIHQAFDFVGRNSGKLTLGVVAAALAVFLATGFYVVKKEELGVLTRFGRVIDANVEPGWHYCVPIIEKTHVRKVLRIEGYQVASADAGTVNFTILTGDTNLLEIAVAVQYQIDNLRNFLFATDDPIQVLTMLIREELVQTVGQNFIDLVLTLNRNVIQQHIEEAVTEELERNDIGVELVALNIVEVSPVEETRAAFRDVSDATADKAQAISNANRDREHFLARSRGQAEAILMDARAKATERVAQAGSSADAFLELLDEYRQQPAQVTVTRYWQRMRTIFKDASLAAVNPGAESTIDINMIDGLGGATPAEMLLVPPARADRPLLSATTRPGEHAVETVDDDKFLVSGQFHSRSAERDDLAIARPRSLIFDSASIFTHQRVKSDPPPATDQPFTEPMVETLAKEEAQMDEQQAEAASE